VADAREWVAGAGWAAPVLFAVLYAGLALTPTPVTVMTLAAGLLFGLPVGLPVALAGAVTAAAVAFALSRVLGREPVERFAGARVARLDELFREHGLPAVVAVRLVPLVPFTALNYACGLTAVRTRDYLLGTVAGILPGITAFVAVGAYGASPGSPPFLLAVGVLVVLGIAGILVARRRAAHHKAARGRTGDRR
ncbi:MAG TPA: VTT domain-containing protein, partial [Pseudonocardia sp.]|nr:VTT domain-containing protein [Pseudonocardia sp.]